MTITREIGLWKGVFLCVIILEITIRDSKFWGVGLPYGSRHRRMEFQGIKVCNFMRILLYFLFLPVKMLAE